MPFSSLPLTRRTGLTMHAHRIFRKGGGPFSPIVAHFFGSIMLEGKREREGE